MRNYEDHTVTLKAIASAREDLKNLNGNLDSLEGTDAIMNLLFLYSCLNIEDLIRIVKDMKSLENHRMREAKSA